jgi:hypothetical protein
MLKGKGRVWKATGATAEAHVIYIPTDIVKDSAYPFKAKETVHVRLDPENKQLIISKEEDWRRKQA